MTVKDELRRLVDDLPDDMPSDELLAAKRFLEYLRQRWADPVVRALDNAPFDDESISEEEEAAVKEARRALRVGDVLSDQDLVKDLGL